MKKYKSQNEVIADIKDGVLAVNEDVKFECSIAIEAKIIVQGNINARDINAGNINAGNINAWNINAGDISFYAVAFAYQSFKCKSIVGRRENNKYFCLNRDVEIVTAPEGSADITGISKSEK